MFLRSLIIGFLLLFSVPTPTLAAETTQAFATNVHTTYTVSLSGETTISHQFTLKNLTATNYVSQYALKTPLHNLKQITATSKSKHIPTEVTKTTDGTTIVLTFDDQVVGENKTRQFTLTYVSKETATILGNVLELYVPSLSDKQVYAQRSVTLKTPLRFGKSTRVTPEPNAVSFDNNFVVTNFLNLGQDGLAALFGDRQFFSLTLRYNLKNPSSASGIAQIALPPDTPYQKMQYQSLDPSPQKLKTDRDGNWIATYNLAPNSTLTVYLTASVRVSLLPSPNIPQVKVAPEHTEVAKFWEIDNPQVLDIAKNLNTAKEIYDYTVATLTYNFPQDKQNLARKGVVEALADPTHAVCQEFTDVFVALARAKNIPARRVTGYAFSSNSELRPLSLQTDVLHAWAEFYNRKQQRWQQVDPTWGNTTGGADYFSQFDLNHITFAINGISSTTPYAAGSYKSQTFTSKDVSVKLSERFTLNKPKFQISIEKRQVFGMAIPGLYLVHVKNQTGQAWYHLSSKFTTHLVGSSVKLQSSKKEFATILPFQTLSFPLLVVTDQVQLPQNTKLQTEISLGSDYNQTTEFADIKTGLLAYQYLNETVIPIILVGSFTLGTLITGSLLVFRRRR